MIKVISTRDPLTLDVEIQKIDRDNIIKNITIATTTVPRVGVCRDWTYVDVLYTAVVIYNEQLGGRELING